MDYQSDVDKLVKSQIKPKIWIKILKFFKDMLNVFCKTKEKVV